jgi:hypothetical protein
MRCRLIQRFKRSVSLGVRSWNRASQGKLALQEFTHATVSTDVAALSLLRVFDRAMTYRRHRALSSLRRTRASKWIIALPIGSSQRRAPRWQRVVGHARLFPGTRGSISPTELPGAF